MFRKSEKNFYTTRVTKRDGRVFICLRPECKKRSVSNSMNAKHALGDANYKIRRALGGAANFRSWMIRELGYCAGELACHLEAQFVDGMDWLAFFNGEIHLDHIVPIRCFDKSSKDDMRACYALSNLRPIWARENLSKSGERTHLI